MRRMEQVNDEIREALASSLTRHLELRNALVTILYVKCSSNFLNATIGISVLPENMSGTALEKLKKLNSALSNDLKKTTRLRHIPRFRWAIDQIERRVADYDRELKELDLT